MKKIFVILALSAVLFSCSTQRFAVSPSVKREVPRSAPHFSKWSHFFVGGIGQTDFKNASKMCARNGGVSFVETKLTFAQGLVGGLTWGIYSPRTMNIYCKKD